MVTDCRICADERLSEAVSEALGAGEPVAAMARRLDLPRTTLRRHVAHNGHQEVPAGRSPRDLMSEAKRLVREAATSRQKLKALEGQRAAGDVLDGTYRFDPKRPPATEARLRRARSDLEEAWRAYEGVGGFEDRLRALGGVRQALRRLRQTEAQARSGRTPVTIQVVMHDGRALGEPVTRWVETDVAERWVGQEIELSFGGETHGNND